MNITALLEIYSTYEENRRKLLNHKRFIDYLFNKRPITTDAYNMPLTYNQYKNENIVKIVRMKIPTAKNKERAEIESLMFLIGANLEDWSITYAETQKYLNMAEIKKIYKQMPMISQMTKPQAQIWDILTKYRDKMGYLSYVPKWTFVQLDAQSEPTRSSTIMYKQKFVYDFFGTVTQHNHLIMFVILYDNATHFDTTHKDYAKIHQIDIYKQHILFQLNVHLLRINARHDTETEISTFLDALIGSTTYIVQNPIKPIYNLFKNSDILTANFNMFVENYKFNHKLYFKKTNKEILIYDPVDNEYYEKITEPQTDKDNTVAYIMPKKYLTNKLESELIVRPKAKVDRADIILQRIGIANNDMIEYTPHKYVPVVTETDKFMEKFGKQYVYEKEDMAMYTQRGKLAGYTWVPREEMHKLIPELTYVKFVKKTEIDNDDMNVNGGLFMSGGIKQDTKSKYVVVENCKKWTHIKIDNKVCVLEPNFEPHKSTSKINDHYYFYKYY